MFRNVTSIRLSKRKGIKNHRTRRGKYRKHALKGSTGGTIRKKNRYRHHSNATTVSARPKSNDVVIKMKHVADLDSYDSHQIDLLIKEAFGDSSITHIDGANYCIFSKLGKKIISALFLKKTCQIPGSVPTIALAPIKSINTNTNDDCMYIHTVCVSDAYRGHGLLHKMLLYISQIERFKKTIFKLEAANTQDHGLNQDLRFQIYSKSGFTLPIGTFVEPYRFTIKNVETSNKNEKVITYTVEQDNGDTRTFSYADIHPEACYFDNVKQNRGCVMETTASNLRDFNTKK